MRKILLLCLFFAAIISCSKIDRDRKVDKNKLLTSDYRIYQDTPAWNLAKAVWDNDVDKIKEEVEKNPKIINYQESKSGKTLLHLSIYNDDYKGFKELLKLGADPNLYDFSHCSSPIIKACQNFKDKTKYVQELIKYGANVNDVECDKGHQKQKMYRTPLMSASGQGNLKLVKLLIQNGAKIDSEGKDLSRAIIQNHYDVVLYLLEQGADCNKLLYNKYNADDSETPIYIKDIVFDSGEIHASKEYNKIVEILKKKGCIDEYPLDYPR